MKLSGNTPGSLDPLQNTSNPGQILCHQGKYPSGIKEPPKIPVGLPIRDKKLLLALFDLLLRLEVNIMLIVN